MVEDLAEILTVPGHDIVVKNLVYWLFTWEFSSRWLFFGYFLLRQLISYWYNFLNGYSILDYFWYQVNMLPLNDQSLMDFWCTSFKLVNCLESYDFFGDHFLFRWYFDDHWTLSKWLLDIYAAENLTVWALTYTLTDMIAVLKSLSNQSAS